MIRISWGFLTKNKIRFPIYNLSLLLFYDIHFIQVTFYSIIFPVVYCVNFLPNSCICIYFNSCQGLKGEQFLLIGLLCLNKAFIIII